jgi:hypothetical protein
MEDRPGKQRNPGTSNKHSSLTAAVWWQGRMPRQPGSEGPDDSKRFRQSRSIRTYQTSMKDEEYSELN